MPKQDLDILRFVFQLCDDGGMGENVFDFAQDEGYDDAIAKVETWREVIEDMLEAVKDRNHVMAQTLMHMRHVLGGYLTNLVIQKSGCKDCTWPKITEESDD
jgi:superfamily I DNA and RNA helicase